jgi:hypothetical protein
VEGTGNGQAGGDEGLAFGRTLSVEPFWRGLSRTHSLGSIPSLGPMSNAMEGPWRDGFSCQVTVIMSLRRGVEGVAGRWQVPRWVVL